MQVFLSAIVAQYLVVASIFFMGGDLVSFRYWLAVALVTGTAMQLKGGS